MSGEECETPSRFSVKSNARRTQAVLNYGQKISRINSGFESIPLKIDSKTFTPGEFLIITLAIIQF
jgi:hypothetical protein